MSVAEIFGDVPPIETHVLTANQAAPPEWPVPLRDAAYHGVIGELVRLIEPHTEADPAALLLQAQTIFGNIIGPGCYFLAEGAKHRLVLYVLVVGRTSKARKGSSMSTLKRVFVSIDDTLKDPARMVSGLSSGEGLIWSVRDPIMRGDSVEDPGVADKRLLVVEEEFASTLKVMGREGNTLSAIIRTAWDSGDLGTLTKTNRAKATGAYISIIGHITGEELKRYLTQTESGNGFANRLLFTCSQRSKLLPEGGELHRVDFGQITAKLAQAIEHARHVGELRRTPEARAMWADIYADLSEGHPGLYGAVTSRAEAQVMRLACLYAVGDMSYVVRPEHLRAALEVWRYCSDSARFLFGTSLGDAVADELDYAIRTAGPLGLSRTDIRDYFGRNRSTADTGRALMLLQENGRIRREMDYSGNGRPVERWIHLRSLMTTT